MSVKYFSCPDGSTIEIKQCYKECRMKERCMCLPALKAVGNQRKWTGKPSVTQLLKGTRESYLQIINDTTIDPFKQIASMIGTNSHSLMENNSPNGWLSEVRLEDDITSGQFDAVDLKNKTLWDFKFFGAYKIAMVLGHRPRWIADGVYQRGANKGKTKWVQKFEEGGVKDTLEIAIQLSYYRKLLKEHGVDIDKIKVQICLRGGLDKTAKSYGLDKQAYVIDIFPLSEHLVSRYMQAKYNALMKALQTNTMPDICKPKDRWSNDRKCKEYCNVNMFCPHYIENYKDN